MYPGWHPSYWTLHQKWYVDAGSFRGKGVPRRCLTAPPPSTSCVAHGVLQEALFVVQTLVLAVPTSPATFHGVVPHLLDLLDRLTVEEITVHADALEEDGKDDAATPSVASQLHVRRQTHTPRLLRCPHRVHGSRAWIAV